MPYFSVIKRFFRIYLEGSLRLAKSQLKTANIKHDLSTINMLYFPIYPHEGNLSIPATFFVYGGVTAVSLVLRYGVQL